MNLNDIDGKISSVKQMKIDMILAEIYRSMPQFKIGSVNLKEDGCEINWSCVINEYEHTDSSHISYNDTISERVEQINKHINYINQLWETYPEHCKMSEKLREYAYFAIPKISSRLLLTDHLILPNSVTFQQTGGFYSGGSGYGGGDYEIKKAFKRAEQYIASADEVIAILTDSIAKLEGNREVISSMLCSFLSEPILAEGGDSE